MTGPTLEPWEATLDYEGTLAALMGLIACQVSVTAADREGKPIIVTRMEGVLRQSHDITVVRDRSDGEAQFFHVGSDADDGRMVGFMLHRGCFGGGDTQVDLQVRFLQGGVLVVVRAEDT